MFTLRFETHDGNYTIFSCQKYHVGNQASTQGVQKVVSMYKTIDDPDAGMIEYIGDLMPYRVCFVMNDIGKTIDTIRMPVNQNFSNTGTIARLEK